MAKRFFLFFIILSLFLGSIAFLLWFGFRHYSAEIVSYFLEKQDCTIEKMQIKSIKKDSASFAMLQGNCKQSQSTQLFTLEDLDLQYEWRNLFAGTLATIAVGKADIRIIENNTNNQIEKETKKDFSNIIIPLFPFPTISIRDIHLELNKMKWDIKDLSLENSLFNFSAKIKKINLPKKILKVSLPSDSKFISENKIKICNLFFQSNPELTIQAIKSVSGIIESGIVNIFPTPSIHCQQGGGSPKASASTLKVDLEKLNLRMDQKKIFIDFQAKPIDFAKTPWTFFQPSLQMNLGELGFSGNAIFDLTLFSLESARIAMLSKNIGISVSEGFSLSQIMSKIFFIMSSHKKELTIKDTSIQTLDGEILISPIHMQVEDTKPSSFTVNLSKISLQKLLQLKQDQEFLATGSLSGTIPCSLEKGEFSVHGGAVASESGGLLRYNPPANASALSGGNQGLSMAINALRNFHYSKLATTLDFLPSGILKMAITLQGKNPDFQNGKVIHFNINLEENILALLKSMSMAEKFGSTIDQRIQDQQQSKTKKSSKKK